MRLLKKIVLIILLIVFIPLTVNAGIICSDGWESSCIVPGPGCCSHHGGIGGGSSYNNYSSNDDSFIDRLNDGEYAGILTIIILGVPIILGLYFEKKELKEKQKVIVNDAENSQEDDDEIAENNMKVDEKSEEIKKEIISEEIKEVVVDNSVEEDTKYNNKVTWIVILIILFVIGLSIYLSKDEKMTAEKFARYITDNVVEKYIENKGEVIDEKIYINDFYHNIDYQDSYYYDTFKEYYEELKDEVKDDYIIIINFDEENYRVFYYYEEDKNEEFVDYIKYYASQYYAEDILNDDWSSKNVKISTLQELGYIKSKYYQDLYNELKKEIINDEIVIYSEITYEDIFEVEYNEK